MTVVAYSDEDLVLSLKGLESEDLTPALELESTGPAMEAMRAAFESEVSKDGAKLWFPGADRSVRMRTIGHYERHYPVGAVVHFTAGRRERGDIDAKLTAQRAEKYCFFTLSSTGKVYQGAPMNLWGYHCDPSSYGKLGSSLGKQLVGIEICCAGKLKKTDRGYEPWWNDEYSSSSPLRTIYSEADVRFAKKGSNVVETGYYHRYTPEQEASLIELVLWLHLNNPAVFKIENVVGHDEIAPSRKNDPGGSLSMNMSAFRDELRQILKLQGNLARPAPPVDLPPMPPMPPPAGDGTPVA